MKVWRPLIGAVLAWVLAGCGPLGDGGEAGPSSTAASEDGSTAPVKVDRELAAASLMKATCEEGQFLLFRNGKKAAAGASSCNYRDGSLSLDVNCSATDADMRPLLMLHAQAKTESANEEVMDAQFVLSDWRVLGLTEADTEGCRTKVKVGGGEFGNSVYSVLKFDGQIRRGAGKYLVGFRLGSICSSMKENTDVEIVACFGP